MFAVRCSLLATAPEVPRCCPRSCEVENPKQSLRRIVQGTLRETYWRNTSGTAGPGNEEFQLVSCCTPVKSSRPRIPIQEPGGLYNYYRGLHIVIAPVHNKLVKSDIHFSVRPIPLDVPPSTQHLDVLSAADVLS